MSDKKNSLLLITVDCLRADHCGFYGYARPTTPFLDSLASESVVVSTAVVAGAPTYYSLPAIFASRMPLALGRDVVGLAPGEDTLATALRQSGFATAAFTAANPYISPHFGYDQGFDEFRDFLDFEVSAPSITDVEKSPENRSFRAMLNSCLKKSACAAGLSQLYYDLYFQYCVRVAAPTVRSMDALRRYPSADVIVDSAESWLSSVDSQPFFLWLHLMDPHHPYYPPAAAFQQLTARTISPQRALYLNEFWNRSDLGADRLQRHKPAVMELYDAGIRCVDSQIGRLVSFLKTSNRWDDCVFALTADHGEEFLEHGRRYHAPVGFNDEIARVPLMFRVPGQPNWKLPAAPFSHLNLAPTLLEILNVPQPPGFQGTSLSQHANEQCGDSPEERLVSMAISECVYGCTNSFSEETRLSERLLSVRDWRYKLVTRLNAGAVEEIYDLSSDPEEKDPLPAGESKQIRARLLRVAVEHLRKGSDAGTANARLRSRLRDLRLKLSG